MQFSQITFEAIFPRRQQHDQRYTINPTILKFLPESHRQPLSLQESSYIVYTCSPDCDWPGTMQVEMLVPVKALNNIQRGTLEGWGASGSLADQSLPQQTVHLAKDCRAIWLQPAMKGLATAAIQQGCLCNSVFVCQCVCVYVSW